MSRAVKGVSECIPMMIRMIRKILRVDRANQRNAEKREQCKWKDRSQMKCTKIKVRVSPAAAKGRWALYQEIVGKAAQVRRDDSDVPVQAWEEMIVRERR